jgi:hypothetical protein
MRGYDAKCLNELYAINPTPTNIKTYHTCPKYADIINADIINVIRYIFPDIPNLAQANETIIKNANTNKLSEPKKKFRNISLKSNGFIKIVGILIVSLPKI